jgi:hypothetical protein
MIQDRARRLPDTPFASKATTGVYGHTRVDLRRDQGHSIPVFELTCAVGLVESTYN